MTLILTILGLLPMAGGAIVYVIAKSAVHEILAAVSFGLGTIAVGIGFMIGVLEDIKGRLAK